MVDSNVKSADRVLTLLERLGEASSEMSHADLAEALGIPKSSLSQLLKTMLARQWLSYAAETKSYSLGPAIAALARRAEQAVSLVELAPAILARLTKATSETSALNLQKGDETEVRATVLSSQRLLSIMREGDRAPLYATSGGKAILAFLPPKAIESYLARVAFQRFTPSTIGSPDRLEAELEQIRATGFAMSLEEYTLGIVGLACPLRDGRGRTVAAINVAVPASRYAPELQKRIVDDIRRAASEFVAQLERTDRAPVSASSKTAPSDPIR